MRFPVRLRHRPARSSVLARILPVPALALCLAAVMMQGAVPAPARADTAQTTLAAETTLPAPAFRQIIQDQMKAFRQGDAAGAFSFATRTLQQLYQTPEIFIGMVRQGYLPVYRPKSVSFGRMKETEQGPVQEVYVTGPDGEDWLALYSFEQQDDGTWKISGCMLTKSPALGV